LSFRLQRLRETFTDKELDNMKAITFEQSGRPEDVLQLSDIPRPVPGENQVLIKVAARPIQPADFLFIGGRYRLQPVFPQPAGLEGVGTIVESGPGVPHLTLGDRVAFRSVGTWAELAIAPVSRIYPVPPGISDEVASQFALNPLTAWGLLIGCSLPPSSRILITAGRSIVARLLVELARHRGVEAILLVRTGTGYSALDGSDNSIVASGATVAATLQDIGMAGYFDAIIDAVGGVDSLTLIDALKQGGRLISYGVLDDSEFTLKASRILYKNLIWQGFGIDGWLSRATGEQLKNALQELWEMLANKPELLPVIGRFDLSDFKEAIGLTRDKHQPGKVLLVN
jgi:NADPH:quinone reductase-like Zn-dependent oxidoreductase